MARFVFRFEKLLSAKEMALRAAEWAEARAIRALGEIDAQTRYFEQQVARTTARLGNKSDPIPWFVRHAQAQRVIELLEEIAARRRQLLDDLERRRAAVREARREVEALRTLRHRHWLQWRKEYFRKQQRLLDERAAREWYVTHYTSEGKRD